MALQIPLTVDVVISGKIASTLLFGKIQKPFGYYQIAIFRIAGDEYLLGGPQRDQLKISVGGGRINNRLFIIPQLPVRKQSVASTPKLRNDKVALFNDFKIGRASCRERV